MKKGFIVILIAIISSCQQDSQYLLGDWQIKDKFYSASYRILKEDHQIKGLILYYNDGTTRYKHDGTTARYFFKNLQKKDTQYVDAMSGATVKNADEAPLTITIKHPDTLEVTTYILDRPIVELWTRKQ